MPRAHRIEARTRHDPRSLTPAPYLAHAKPWQQDNYLKESPRFVMEGALGKGLITGFPSILPSKAIPPLLLSLLSFKDFTGKPPAHRLY